jgi:surface carbohydrate biosynthesis protein (TIGR04326 family)
MRKLENNKTLLIWDRDEELPDVDSPVILWSSFSESEPPNIISLPKVVENQSEYLRHRYLEWIYDIGETKIHDKRVVDHFELKPEFSFWWMSLISHKPNYYQSQHINDVIKCLAFEILYFEKFRSYNIKIVTTNVALKIIFRDFCKKSEVSMISEDILSESFLSKPVLILSSFSKGIAYLLITIIKSIKNFSFKDNSWPENLNSTVCIFDILVYLKENSFLEGKFSSGYWTSLVNLLNDMGLSTTWVHTYFKHPEINSVKEASSLMDLFNLSNKYNYHGLIDSQISFFAACKAIRYYFQVVYNNFRIGEVSDLFKPSLSNFNFWPLFKNNWYDSFLGIHTVKGCISISVYENFLNKIPHQKIGIYIQENQPWEIAIINAWRKAGHGKLIGVPHTTVRFWDLRYFYAPQTYSKSSNSLPRPDCVALNGPVSFDIYKRSGYPVTEMVEVEALRYLHLKSRSKQQFTKDSDHKRILVLGDNIVGSNERLIEMIYHANKDISVSVNFVFKSHKARVFKFTCYHSENFIVSEENIFEQMHKSDVVITGNITSAAVDAYYFGLPVLTLIDPKTLNSSPLRDIKVISYFSTVSELTEIINKSLYIKPDESKSYFNLNNDLFLWKRLILKSNYTQTRSE